MSFQTRKATFLQRAVISEPKRLSKSDFSQSNTQLTGGLGRLYRWLGMINDGNNALSHAIGLGQSPSFKDAALRLKYRPLFEIPEPTNVSQSENGLDIVYMLCYQMGWDLFPYYLFNAVGAFNSAARKQLQKLHFAVSYKPLFSVNDIARENGGESGALTHMTDILRMLVDDFSVVTLAAPIKPPQILLAIPQGFQ